MVRVAKGEWIHRALRLLEETKGLDAASRRRHLAAEKESFGGSVQTAHRQMTAARKLEGWTRTLDVPLGEVVAAYTGVEALARLEAARPDHFDRIARDALLGRLTSRQVMDIASMTRTRSRRLDWPSQWEAFLIDEVLPYVPVAIPRYLDADLSSEAKCANVDVELALDDGRSFAVVLSPLIVYARNVTFMEAFRAVTTARTFFDQVTYMTYDEDELRFMREREPKVGGLAPLVFSPTAALQRAKLDLLPGGVEIRGAERDRTR